MQTHKVWHEGVIGFVELKVGSVAVKVPICTADTALAAAPPDAPVAAFEEVEDGFAIIVRGEPTSAKVKRAVQEAAHVAERHYSRKLLN